MLLESPCTNGHSCSLRAHATADWGQLSAREIVLTSSAVWLEELMIMLLQSCMDDSLAGAVDCFIEAYNISFSSSPRDQITDNLASC